MPRVSSEALKLGFVLALSAVCLALGALLNSRSITAIVSASTLAAILLAGVSIASRDSAQSGALPNLIRGFSEIFALTCLWAAASLYLCYGAAGLRWQHGHQYALGFLLLSAAHGAFIWLDRGDGPPDRRARLIHWALGGLKLEVTAVAAALCWLIATGKLATIKKDWAANDVFLASGFAVLGLAFLLFRAVRRDDQT